MKTLIICAGDNKNPDKLKEFAKNSDYIICADGGYCYAVEVEIIPDLLIGDFDSLKDELPENIKIIKLPCEKDETDTLFAFHYAKSIGATEIVIYGALGGDRFEHSYANICLMAEALENNMKICLTDGKTICYMTDSIIKLKGKKGSYISVFSFSDISYNINIKGLKYPLCNYTMKKYDSIGISNEFTGSEAEVSVGNGKLLIICN